MSRCRILFIFFFYNWRHNILCKTLLKNYTPYLFPLSQGGTDSSSPSKDSCHKRPPHSGKGWWSFTDTTWRTNTHSSQHLPAELANPPRWSSYAPNSQAPSPVRAHQLAHTNSAHPSSLKSWQQSRANKY